MTASNHNNFDPSSCISNKVRQLNRIVANIYRPFLSAHNITDSQTSILFVLYKKGRLSQKDICLLLLLEKSSLNRNLNRLIERGLISKAQFPLIELTASGTKLVNEIIPGWKKAMEETQRILNDDGLLAVNLLHQKVRLL